MDAKQFNINGTSVLLKDEQARNRIAAVEGKLPSDASSSNKLITKTVDDLVNYYLKSETYTKSEVEALIGAIQHFHYEVYASTGAVTNPQSNVLYLIGPTGSGSDRYEEYVYTNNTWTKIGDTSIDLSGYVTTEALNTALAAYTTTANLTTLLAGKQDVIADLETIREKSNNAIQAEPVGQITPSVDPYEYATKAELDELGQYVSMDSIQGDIIFDKSFSTSGALIDDAGVAISPYIDVSANRTVYIKPGIARRYIGYNASKEYVDYYSVSASGGSRTLPNTIYYIRIAFLVSDLQNVYVSKTDASGNKMWYPVITWSQRFDTLENEVVLRKIPRIDGSAFVTGKMWQLNLSVGDTAPTSMYSTSVLSCARLKVVKGQSFIVNIVPGASADGRAYCLTDDNLKVLAISSQAQTLTNFLIEATQDGWLYFNTSEPNNVSIVSQNTILDIYGLLATQPPVSPKYINAPFPRWKSSLKVLAIGNSFTVDATQYISELMSAANNDPTKLGLYRVYSGGATIDFYVSELDTNNAWEAHLAAGSIAMTTTGTLAQLVSQDWDVIIIQQASDVSFDWSTYSKLSDYVRKIRMLCTNPNVTIGWHLVWGHTQTTNPTTGLTDVQELSGNIDCCKRVAQEIGIDFIIPVGTAIQNARGTSLQTSKNMTRDDWHLAYGVPYYVAACVWYAMIVAPLFGTALYGNTAVHPITPGGSEDVDGAVSVTSSNNTLCQRCAMYAVADMYDVNVPE